MGQETDQGALYSPIMFEFPLGGRPKALAPLLLPLAALFFVSTTPVFAQSAESTEVSPVAPAADLEEAKLHFSNGVELLQVTPPNYQDAFRQFELAYEKSGRSWKVAGNLGLCALKLERDGEALAFYEQYLKEGGDEIELAERNAIERDLLLVKGNMATLEVRSGAEDTTVTVSRKGSSAPAQTYAIAPEGTALGLRSGELTLTAEAGEKVESWTITVGPEEKRSHLFSFVPEKSTTTPPPPPTPTSEKQEKSQPSALRTTGYVVGGVGLLAIVGGVVSGIVAKSAENSAAEQCIGTVCPEDVEADFQSASDMATLANVLFISGGVLTATGVTLVIVGGKSSKGAERARLELTPRLGAGSYGLFAHGHF